MSELLRNIREAIRTSEMTRYQIAKQSGIAQSQLSRLMHGEAGISVENLERLAQTLGFEITMRPKRPKRKASR